VLGGQPVVTGIVSVGDAWSCTNPSLGRGMTMGLMHAAGTAGVIREHAGLFRGLAEIMSMRTRPEEVLSRPGFLDRARQIAAACGPPVPAGPCRAEVLRLLS